MLSPNFEAAPALDNVQLAAIAAEFGTPVYVYHAERVQYQYRQLAQAFRHFSARILYACKANNNLNLLHLLRREGAGIDAVSISEVELALRAGFTPQQILFTPNMVGFAEIEAAVSLGVLINIDSIGVLEQFGARYGGAVPVMIRLNPHIYAGGHGNIQTGHIDSKFGISIHQLRHVLRVVRGYRLRVVGLHMHTGSDILDSEVFLQAAEVLYGAALEFEDLVCLDFGSGFKVAYREDDHTTDIQTLGLRLAERHARFCQEYGRELEIWFEPGKYIVSEAGYLLVRANQVKQTVSTVFVGVDSGLNHLIRPMLYDAYHRIWNVSHPEGLERIYSVVGNICETDTLGWDRRLNEVRVGDTLALGNAGAYGFSMASQYNGRVRPAEVLVQAGEAHLVRRRETLDDLLATTVLLPQLADEVQPQAEATLL